MNLSEVEEALQLVNNQLISEKELQYIYHVSSGPILPREPQWGHVSGQRPLLGMHDTFFFFFFFQHSFFISIRNLHHFLLHSFVEYILLLKIKKPSKSACIYAGFHLARLTPQTKIFQPWLGPINTI